MYSSDYLLEPLTQRELEILGLLAEGFTDREIAEVLALAQNTVKRSNKQLYSKLRVQSRSEAVNRAREFGLLADFTPTLLGGTVTFLFTDIQGSTKLWQRHPEVMSRALEQHDALLRWAIEGHDGRVFKTVGDAFCAVFDDAMKALSAAQSAQRAILAQDWGKTPIRIRMALHTGTAEVRDDDYFGPSVNHVARLLAAGHGGQILVSDATRALAQSRLPVGLSFRDLGEHRLRDLEQAERIYQLIATGLSTDFPPLVSLDAHPYNLPVKVTTFVGREREIKILDQLLAENRLLTLSGPPGTGKTRLAIHVAKRNLDRFHDGIYFVDLAPISDPQLVISAIAQVLNLQESSSQTLFNILTYYLRHRQALLLLDNFEQVIEVAPLAGNLLAACPNLKLLITSREPLRVYGEQEYPVPPLAMPGPDRPERPQEISQYEAVELFCQRARAVKPDFRLTEVNAPYVSEICVRLDGLPLAIELAAARSKLLSPENMCARLESRLLTLTGGARDLPARMQTLRAAIDWSYELLDDDQQRLFDRLSVFQGGRMIDAAETVCGVDLASPVFDSLESLLNKNLLYAKEGATGETRFYMLETIHEYAHERLAHSGEADEFKRRHVTYFVALAERAEVELHGLNQAYWFARLTDELDNIRAALNWTLDGQDLELGARLVAALREYWYMKGLLSETTRWLDRILEYQERLSAIYVAKTLNTASLITLARGAFVEGATLARQALLLARDINDIENCAWASLYISTSLIESDGQIKEVLTHAEEGLRLFRELDHKGGIVLGLNTLGELARLDGDYARAGQFYEESLALSIELGNKEREAVSLANLTYVAYQRGDYNRAINYGKEALSLMSSLEVEHAIAVVLAITAGPIGAGGRPELAARLLAASETQMEAIGASLKPQDKLEVDRYKKAVREQLGEREFNKAWAEGLALSIEQALAEVVAET